MTGRRRAPRSPARAVRIVSAAALLLAGAGVLLAVRGGQDGSASSARLDAPGEWRPAVPPGRVLVANERDTGDDPGAVRSPDWYVTSGSWFADSGSWWSGPIDGRRPDPRSARTTGSAVLRVVTTRRFADCRVEFDLRADRMASTPRTPPRAYDGVHVFVRYRDPGTLYAVAVLRRDGLVVVKKKQAGAVGRPGVDEEGYTTLASAPGAPALGERVHVAVTVRDVAAGVRITLVVDGATLLDVVDAGTAGPALVGAGRVGLRADNTEFRAWDVRVTDVRPRGR